MKFEYTSADLHEIGVFMDNLDNESVKVVSPRADAVLRVDGEETPFALLLADDGTYYLSLVVPL